MPDPHLSDAAVLSAPGSNPILAAPVTRRALLAAASLGGATLLSGCGSAASTSVAPPVGGAAVAPTTQPPVQPPVGQLGRVVQANLAHVKTTVSAISDPITGKSPVIPDYDALFAAAGRLDGSRHAAQSVTTISQLLGRAIDVGNEAPSATYALQFPRDHHYHPTMGLEWYYICMHLQVTDDTGTAGRVGVLAILEKQRVVGLSVAQQFGWSDLASSVFASMVTATVDLPTRKAITRRSTNVQWPANGGSASFSVPGETFAFQCGSDSLRGPVDVLPLTVKVDDGSNLSLGLTLLPAPGFTAPDAFFLQGVPNAQTAGTGLTTIPTPGIYYSWPQLRVDMSAPSNLTVDGRTYTITGGTAWIDHELLMQSLENPGGATSPIPFTDDRRPYNGWCWQFFNLANGDAFTGSAFQNWFLGTTPAFSYGYYVTPNAGRWTSLFVTGDLGLGGFQGFNAIPGDASSPTVPIATTRDFSNIRSILGIGTPLKGSARYWLPDGTFNFPALETVAENPADYVDTSGVHPNGVGFCESVGFESTDSYRKRSLAFLQG